MNQYLSIYTVELKMKPTCEEEREDLVRLGVGHYLSPWRWHPSGYFRRVDRIVTDSEESAVAYVTKMSVFERYFIRACEPCQGRVINREAYET